MPLAQVLWNSTQALPVAGAVALLVVTAVAWLYPGQVREVRGPWRWGLPALRGTALLALSASLAKPAFLRPKTVDERPVVVVLVDHSRSMSVTDNARTPAGLVALAAGLGRLPPGTRSKSVASLANDLSRVGPLVDAAARALGDLDYARVSGRGAEEARRRADDAASTLADAAAAFAARSDGVGDAQVRARLADLHDAAAAVRGGAGAAAAIQSLRPKLADAMAATEAAQGLADEQLFRSDASVRGACEALSRLSRIELAYDALVRPETGVLAGIGRQANVVAFSVADDLVPLPLGAEAPAGALRDRADGHASDVAGAVRRALDRVPGREVAAVVFFSDGRQVGGQGTVTAGLSAAGVPIFAVAAGPVDAIRDVSFGSVSLPLTAFSGETVTVTAALRPTGLKSLSTDINVSATDIGVAAPSQPVTSTDGKPVSATFQLKLDRPGAQRLTLAAKPTPGEATDENNVIHRWVKVLAQKVKVAAYAASPAWDYQYLRNALSRTSWVELSSGVLSPDEAARLPLTPQQILEQDVLILNDVPAAALDEAQWDAVYRMVSERGGSAILIAGEAHLPAEYGRRQVTANLLPYAPELTPTWRMWPGEQPLFRLAPHPDAAGKPLLRLGDDLPGGGPSAGDGRVAERWQALPGLYRFLPIGGLKPTSAPLLMEAASGAPVLTETRVGAGRSFLFGANETWRWRLKAGERDQDRFWLNLVRYAAGEPYGVRSGRLSMDLSRFAIDAGESVRVRVRVLQDPVAPAADARDIRVELVRGSDVVQVVPLSPIAPAAAGRMEATLTPPGPADYQVRLVGATPVGRSSTGAPAAPPAGPSLPLHVATSYEAELADVSVDESILRRLAEASGGEFFTLEQVGRLNDRLRLAAERRPRYVEQRLWDSPFLFVFVVGCLAAEWAARKRLGLA